MGGGGRRSRASSSTRRTASTAKPATSRTRIRTSPGCRRKAAAGRTIRICDDRRGGCGHDAATSGFSSRRHRRAATAVLAGAAQKGHSRPQPRRFARIPRPSRLIGASPVTSSSARSGAFVGTALAASWLAAPIDACRARRRPRRTLSGYDGFGQLSRRPPCRPAARRRRRRRLLPRRAQARPEATANCSTAPSCRCWSTAMSTKR